jgi:Brp/Blh family beta-carotene 15,15'-monooxygenase
LEKEYAYKILDEVIKRKFGNYEIIDYESGNIPMTNLVNPHSIFKGVLNTGVSANLIKPSTGYGFKNMYCFAEKLTSKIGKGDFENFNRFSIKLNRRFRFYDSLLLIILLKWPFQGKKIFTQLFNSQNVFTLFSFLDEKTSLKNEVKIFLNLPILPFLRALVIYLKEENLLRYFIAFVSIMVFATVDYFSTEAALNFSYVVIIFGLISIGIPHGALDHLLHPNSYNSLLKFILSYLLIVFIYFIFWQFYPLLSLTIFIIYSSFHFGESELVELGVKIKTVSYYLIAFSLGIAILTFILFTHTTEALSIVSAMSGFEFSELVNKQIASYSSSISMVALLFVGILALVKRKIAFVWLLFLLLLGIIVPLTFAFILYFVFQHSFNAWSHLKNGLDVNSISLYKKALPFTIGAMLVLIILAIIKFNELLDVQNVMPFFYVFLACISLPHIILMHFFYKKNQ